MHRSVAGVLAAVLLGGAIGWAEPLTPATNRRLTSPSSSASPAPPPPGPVVPPPDPLPANVDLSLDQAIDSSLEKNLELLARRYDVKIADARILTARMHPNPTLSLGADHLDWLGTGYNEDNAAGPPEYAIRTDFTLEGGGKRGYRIAVAQLAKEVSQLQLLDAARQLVLDVQSAFVDVLLARSNLALARENRSAFERISDIATHRVKAGDLARVEMMRTRLAALQYENSVVLAQAKLRTAKQRLSLLIGRPRADADYDVAGNLPRSAPIASPAELEKLALSRRPDYLSALKDQDRSQAAISLEEAKGKLDYVLGFELRRQQGLAGRGNSVGLFLSVPLPVYDTNEGEIERARQEYNQLLARNQALQAEIHQQILSAYEQFQAAEKTVNQIESNMLSQARQVLDTMEYAYRSGAATLVELLDAQRAYNDTVLSYNEALAEYARSRYTLEATAGRGARL